MCFCALSVIRDCILHARIYEQLNTCEITAEQQFPTEAVVSRKVSSKWLKNYENPKGHRVMSYIEDEELIDGLYNFLDEVLSRAVGTFERIVRDRIILDVLMPEALIKAIQTVERISLPEAENLFMDGPVYSECEWEEFDILVLQQLEAQEKHH
ncbi:PWWP domain-containing DNA repair factor 3A-like isoform X1 [Erpetoichthys calabaricus]|uniref:PWWP domain-containing DNA repair factor 3A-like isoform X1 n=2 Tax=Erpetoichthys calabaricus TaxID=27687 RepID=UPI00109FC41C|nr:PWWP domain-containing DNA repair factor 3A-like isoform X1 [Erpetoichthys calabaricus]